MTASLNGKTIIIDESHNKVVCFAIGNFNGAITYTGVAQWHHSGRTTRLHDVITDALSGPAQQAHSIGDIIFSVISAINASLNRARLQTSKYPYELHIVVRNRHLFSEPVVLVASTFREKAPWEEDPEFTRTWKTDGVSTFFTVATKPLVVFGGATDRIPPSRSNKIRAAITSGASAANAARMFDQLIAEVAKKTLTVGEDSVCLVIPQVGMLDTNYWRKSGTEFLAYIPAMVFPNGTVFQSSIFPVSLSLIGNSHLPRNELLLSSVLFSGSRGFRRRLKRKRSGKPFGGLFGLLMIAFFGQAPDGYQDFGFDGQSLD